MAKLWIVEFEGLAQIPNQGPQMFDLSKVLNGFNLDIGAGSIQSSTFNLATGALWLNCEAACLIATGLNPDAATSFFRLSAGAHVAIAVQKSANHKIAVIQG